MEITARLQQLLQRLDQPFTGEVLFDCLPDIVFFIKDSAGKYLAVNQTLVLRSGLEEKSELIGRKPTDFLGARLATAYEVQDESVIGTRQAITNKLELHRYANQKVGWCLTSKFPLLAGDGEALGLIGISQDLRLPNLSTTDYRHVAAAIRFAEENIAAAPTVKDLAAVASMSPYRLDRRLRRVFGLTTGQWMLKLRIDLAQEQLLNTELPVASVAHNAGYADQSAFTRQFRLTTGLSPSAFRQAGRQQSDNTR